MSFVLWKQNIIKISNPLYQYPTRWRKAKQSLQLRRCVVYDRLIDRNMLITVKKWACKIFGDLCNLVFGCQLFFCSTLNRTHIGNHKYLHKISINQNFDCFITFILNSVKLRPIALPNATRKKKVHGWLTY